MMFNDVYYDINKDSNPKGADRCCCAGLSRIKVYKCVCVGVSLSVCVCVSVC